MTRRYPVLPAALLLLSLLLFDPSSASAQAPKEVWELPLGLNWDMSLQDVLQLLSNENNEEGLYMEVDTSFFVGAATWVDGTLYGEHYWNAGVYTTVPWNLHEVRFNFDRGESGEVETFRRISAKLRAEYGTPTIDLSPDRYAKKYNDEDIEFKVYEKELEIYEQWQDTVDSYVFVLRHDLYEFNSHIRWMAYGVEEE
jgi:hypothetical protein